MKEKVLYFLNFLTGKFYPKRRYQPGKVRRITVVKLDEIGDMVYAIPVFDVLKQKFPEAKITVYCRAVTANLIENQPSVDEIVHQWDRQNCDIWIEMRGNFTTWFMSLMARPSFRLDRGTVRFRNKLKGAQKQELYTNLEIIEPLLSAEEYKNHTEHLKPVVYSTTQNEIRADFFRSKYQLDNYCVFHTGARDMARRWPIERFKELAEVIHSRLQLRIVIAGGPEEKEWIEQHLPGFPEGTVSFCGVGSLTDFKELCRKADFFVGNESGPLHIASTCEIPIVGLFGPGVKDVFYPIGPYVSVIHYLSEDGTPLSGSHAPILRISVAEVWGNIVKLLNQQKADKML